MQRTAWLLALAGLLALTATAALQPLQSNDTWIHLTTGRLILEEGVIPREDRYSFTAEGAPHVPHEWLSQVIYAVGERAGGLPGALVSAKLLPALVLLAALLAAIQAARVRAGLALPFAVAALCATWFALAQARPGTLGVALALGALALLLRDRERSRAGLPTRAAYGLVPLLVVWVNVHGSFPFGLALLAGFAAAALADRALAARGGSALAVRALLGAGGFAAAAGLATLDPPAFARPAAAVLALAALLVAVDARVALFETPQPAPGPGHLRRLAWAGLLAALGTLANPIGPALLTFPFAYAGDNPLTRHVAEWQPLIGAHAVAESPVLGAYLVLVASWCVALGLAARRGRLGRLEFGLALGLALLPLRHMRLLALFALLSPPLLARMLEAACAPATPVAGAADRRLRGAVGGAFVVAGAAALGAALAAALRAPPDLGLRVVVALGALAAAAGLAPALHPRFSARVGLLATAATGLALGALGFTHGFPEVAGVALRPVPLRSAAEPDLERVPVVPAVRFLAQHGAEGRLFTEYDWAGYAIHELWPGVHVFIDSRTDVYGLEFLERYARILERRSEAERAFAEWDVDLVLVRYLPFPGDPAFNAAILGALEADPRWTLHYVDDAALLYARGEAARRLPAPLAGLVPRHFRSEDSRGAGREDVLREALLRAPGSSFLRFALAAALRSRGEAALAGAELERAWQANPNQAAAPFLAGVLAVEAGEVEAARRWFERAARAAPGWPAPAGWLARLAAQPTGQRGGP